MKKIGNSFIIAFAMYSKIPMPRTEWTKDNMKYAMCFFPVIGAVIGAVILLWNYIQGYAGFGNSFYTVVLMMIPVLITGGIHLDGLLDTSDALSSYKPETGNTKRFPCGGICNYRRDMLLFFTVRMLFGDKCQNAFGTGNRFYAVQGT